jgi:hypothetical protein
MKQFLIRLIGKRYKNVEWAKRNKKWIGLVFASAGFYVWSQGCPGLEQYCAQISLALTNVGSFLTGAGILDSDFRSKFVQGLVKKEEK